VLFLDKSCNFVGNFTMECLIGIKGRDFVLMATDCTAGRSIIAMKKGVHVLYFILLVMHYSSPIEYNTIR